MTYEINTGKTRQAPAGAGTCHLILHSQSLLPARK